MPAELGIVLVAAFMTLAFRRWITRTSVTAPNPQHETRRVRRQREQEAQRRRLHGR